MYVCMYVCRGRKVLTVHIGNSMQRKISHVECIVKDVGGVLICRSMFNVNKGWT